MVRETQETGNGRSTLESRLLSKGVQFTWPLGDAERRLPDGGAGARSRVDGERRR